MFPGCSIQSCAGNPFLHTTSFNNSQTHVKHIFKNDIASLHIHPSNAQYSQWIVRDLFRTFLILVQYCLGTCSWLLHYFFRTCLIRTFSRLHIPSFSERQAPLGACREPKPSEYFLSCISVWSHRVTSLELFCNFLGTCSEFHRNC